MPGTISYTVAAVKGRVPLETFDTKEAALESAKRDSKRTGLALVVFSKASAFFGSHKPYLVTVKDGEIVPSK